MTTDKAIKWLHNALKREMPLWRGFRESEEISQFYEWYYAEERIYLIRDKMTKQIFFTEAGNPWEAFMIFREVVSNGGMDNETD